VVEIMHTDFETVPGEPIAERVRNAIFSFRNKIEAGTKAAAHFQFRECPNLSDPRRTFHVVG